MDWVIAMTGMGVALGSGLIVGMEREHHQREGEEEERRFGGVRTFGLLALVGGAGGLMLPALGPWLLVALALVLTLTFAGLILVDMALDRGRGITTELAACAVFLLGAMSTIELDGIDREHRWLLVAAASTLLMGMLSFRGSFHRLAEAVSGKDLRAAFQLGVLLLVVLPLLPDEGLGPSGLINPFELGLLVALIAAIGFAGYVAVRTLGDRTGMVLTGLLGGLASSTAVALQVSGRVKEVPALERSGALAVVLASAVMVPRVALELTFVSTSLLPSVAPSLITMTVIGLIGAAVVARGRGEENVDVDLKNPFSMSQALKFGALFAALQLAVGLATARFGDAGLYTVAGLGGLTDADALVLSVGRLHQGGLASDKAATAVVLAICSNTLGKAGLAWFLGGRGLGLRVGGVLLLATAGGLLALLIP